MKKIFINNLLIILIFFFVFEFFLKTFELSDLRGHGKEFNKKQKNVETVIFGKKVYLNEYGYRVADKDFKYKNKNKRTIFIGDSVLFGSGVNENDTFVSKLRDKNDNSSFINAGIIGNDINENLTSIKKNNQLFDNSIFFVVYTLDDILNVTKENINTDEIIKEKTLIQKLKGNNFFSKINEILRSKSYTYLWLKGKLTKPSERYFFKSYKSYEQEDKIKFLKEKIIDIKKINTLNTKFLILPYEYQTRNNCEEELMKPQKEIIKLLDEFNIAFIDFSSDFCNYHKPKKLYLNFDPVHLSVEGHDLVFKILEKN
jgi:hypothetical protein